MRIKELFNKTKQKIHSNENSKNVFYNFVGAFFVKGGALLVSFLTIPAYFRYFKNDNALGIWFTIISIVSWILNFDLGIGNGLRNHLVHAIEKKDENEIKSLISSSYLVITPIAAIFILFSIFFFKEINWSSILNVSESIIPRKTLSISITIIFSGIMLQFLLKIINSILYSLQKSAINNLLILITSTLILVFISSYSFQNESRRLINLSIFYTIAVNIPLLIASIIVFSTTLRKYKPKVVYFTVKHSKKILSLGGNFFFIQIMYMIITTTNEFLINIFTNSQYVVEYKIYNRVFTFAGILFTLALTPVWSAITKAYAQNEVSWLKKLYKLMSKIAFLFILMEIMIVPFLQFFFDVWLKENSIPVNYFYALMFASYGSMLIWNGVISSIVNGLGELKTQTIFFTIGAIIKIPIAYFFVILFDSWIGVVVSNIVALGLYCIIQPFWIARFLKNIEKGENNA